MDIEVKAVFNCLLGHAPNAVDVSVPEESSHWQFLEDSMGQSQEASKHIKRSSASHPTSVKLRRLVSETRECHMKRGSRKMKPDIFP
jgi:hypothetical protein